MLSSYEEFFSKLTVEGIRSKWSRLLLARVDQHIAGRRVAASDANCRKRSCAVILCKLVPAERRVTMDEVLYDALLYLSPCAFLRVRKMLKAPLLCDSSACWINVSVDL